MPIASYIKNNCPFSIWVRQANCENPGETAYMEVKSNEGYWVSKPPSQSLQPRMHHQNHNTANHPHPPSPHGAPGTTAARKP